MFQVTFAVVEPRLGLRARRFDADNSGTNLVFNSGHVLYGFHADIAGLFAFTKTVSLL
jgi:hypothetical protein